MATERVHRDLAVTSSLTTGPDVEALQRALNRTARQFPRLLDFRLVEDGEFGELTLKATLRTAHIQGVLRRRLDQIEKQRMLIQPVQRVLRRPETRSDAQKRRSRQRRDDLKKKLEQRPSLGNVRVTLRAGSPLWGGSNDVMTQFVEPFMVKRGLPLGSGKRTPAHNAAIGGSQNSDHLTTKTMAAARDFPTFSGEDDARALAAAMAINGWRPNSHTVFSITAGGHAFRAQILWGSAIAHGDHIHVGITRA